MMNKKSNTLFSLFKKEIVLRGHSLKIMFIAKYCLLCIVVSYFSYFLLGWYQGLVTGSICVVLIVSSVFTLRFDDNFDIDLYIENNKIQVGEEIICFMAIKNKSAKRSRICEILIKIEDITSNDDSEIFVDVPKISAGCEIKLKVSLPSNNRKTYYAGPVYLKKTDLWNMFSLSKIVNIQKKVSVYPKIYSIKNLMNNSIVDFETQNNKKPGPDGYSLHSLRQWNTGDSLKNIHWKSSAKFGQLQVKQFEELSKSCDIFLLNVDFKDNEFEEALSVFGSLFLSFLKKMCSANIMQYNPYENKSQIKIIKCMQNNPLKKQISQCFEYLSNVKCYNSKNFNQEGLELKPAITQSATSRVFTIMRSDLTRNEILKHSKIIYQNLGSLFIYGHPQLYILQIDAKMEKNTFELATDQWKKIVVVRLKEAKEIERFSIYEK